MLNASEVDTIARRATSSLLTSEESASARTLEHPSWSLIVSDGSGMISLASPGWVRATSSRSESFISAGMISGALRKAKYSEPSISSRTVAVMAVPNTTCLE